MMIPFGYEITGALRSVGCRKKTFPGRTIMMRPRLKKGAMLSVLILCLTATALAGEDRPIIADLGKGPAPQKKNVTQPIVIEKYDYYEVGGCCEKDIQCDLKQKCIKWSDGKKYDSITSWKVKWDYGYDRAPETCSVDSFRVTVAISFRFPKWARPGDAPQQLVDKWDSYMKNLVIHENGHRDMAVEVATELSSAVADLPPALTCAEIDREVQKLSRTYMMKLKEDEKEYDAATNHGHTQGAVFP
jgi:predicted secreted Zn-dependent protease